MDQCNMQAGRCVGALRLIEQTIASLHREFHEFSRDVLMCEIIVVECFIDLMRFRGAGTR
jgi:hypothetical protein